MSLPLPKKFLLKGEVRMRVVSNGALEQEKSTQVFLLPIGRSLKVATFVLGDDGNSPMAIVGDTDIIPFHMGDVLGAVRGFRLTETLPRIDAEAAVLCMTAPYFHLMKPEDEDVRRWKAQVADLVGQTTLDRVLKEVPGDLVEMMVRVRNEFGVPLYTDTVTDAVEAGFLEYSAALEQLGVEHPRKRRERIAHRDAVLEQVRPHCQAFCEKQGQGKEYLKAFERAAILASARKLTEDTELLVGVSILTGLAMMRHSETLFSFIVPPLMAEFYGSNRNDFAIGIVAEFLALRFEGKTSPNTVKNRLKELLIKWDKTEPDEAL